MKKIFLIPTALLFMMASCAADEDIRGGASISQQAVLIQNNKEVAISAPATISATSTDEGNEKEISYQMRLYKENNQDITATLSVDNEWVKKYNAIYGTSYRALPEKYISFDKELIISQGSISSQQGKAKVLIAPELRSNTPYMFALSVTAVGQGVAVAPSAKTLFVTVEKVKGQIKNTVAIKRDAYFALERGGSDVSDIGSTFTMEGLIFIEKLRSAEDQGEAGISTFMGTEGSTLMRFGDAGVDPDHLQANGQDIGIRFRTGRWYHIALVVDGGKTIAYVNGTKVTEFNKTGSLGTFFIGRSWSGNRGIEARFSEVRLWKTARTAIQIKDNMFDVNPKTEGLYAYWKMNEVSNNKILDASGNDRNLQLMGQAGKSGVQTISIFNEKENVKIQN